MDKKELRRISIASNSVMAVLMKEAVAAGTVLEVDTGEETYQVDVRPVATAQSAYRLRQLAHQMAGSLATVDIPEWHSSTAAEHWVDELRQSDTSPPEPSPEASEG